MKKCIVLLLTVIMLFSLSSCKTAFDQLNPFSRNPGEEPFSCPCSLTVHTKNAKTAPLSEHADGSAPSGTLTAEKAEGFDNITYDWLPANLDTVQDGLHNGKNYLAYTFYITNSTDGYKLCNTTLNIKRASRGIDDAIRLMVFMNADPEVFAKTNATTDSNGDPLPFESIYEKAPGDPTAVDDPNEQNRTPVATTAVPLVITPFSAEDVAFSGQLGRVESGERVKFTIVVWVEGEDPECRDEMRDGAIELDWEFYLQ